MQSKIKGFITILWPYEPTFSYSSGKWKPSNWKSSSSPGGGKCALNATPSTWWQRDSYFFAKNTPAPSDKLTISNVSVKFTLGTFVWLWILLLILVPGCLQHPSVETNSLETGMMSYTNWGFSNLPHPYCLPVFIAHLRKLWTARAFLISAPYLAIFTCTPKVNKLCLTWIYCTVKTLKQKHFKLAEKVLYHLISENPD